MSAGTDGYSFSEGIPIEPIDPGVSVLVTGSSLSGAEDLARSMVADGVDRNEGTLFISTNMTAGKLLETCRETHPSLTGSLVGVIDCSGQEPVRDRSGIQVKYVSTQSDLTGIGMKYSALYESLYAEAENGRIRTGLISLSSLSMYVDLRTLFKFSQTLSSRIDSAGGIGVFSMDPTTHETKTVNTLSHVTDGRIEVREPENADGSDGELRVRGLRGQPEEWQPFTLP